MGTHTPKQTSIIFTHHLDELKRKAALCDEQQAKIDELVICLQQALDATQDFPVRIDTARWRKALAKARGEA